MTIGKNLVSLQMSEISVLHNESTITAISESNEIKILWFQISEHSKKLDALTTSYSENWSHSWHHSGGSSFSRNYSISKDLRLSYDICYYNWSFGSCAQKVNKLCSLSQAGNDARQSQLRHVITHNPHTIVIYAFIIQPQRQII